MNKVSQRFSPENYFVGLGFGLVSIRVLSIGVHNLRVCLGIILLITVAFILLNLDRRNLKFRMTKTIGINSSILTLVIFTYLYMALVPITEFDRKNLGSLDPWGGATVLVHGFRASNLALRAVELNLFPVINQNVSQSVLALMVGIPTGLAPLGIFPIQMATTLVFLTLLISKILSKLGLSSNYSIFFTIVVLFMNSSAGSQYSSSTDTGSSLILLKSHDALLGIGIFLTILIQLFENEALKGPKNVFLRKLLVPAVLSAALALVFGSYAFYIPFLVFALPREKFSRDKMNQNLQNLRIKVKVSSILFASYLSIASINGFLMLTKNNLDTIPSSDRGSLNPKLRNLLAPENFVWQRESWYAYNAEVPKAVKAFIEFFHLEFLQPKVGFSTGLLSLIEYSKSMLVVILINVIALVYIKLNRDKISSFGFYWIRITYLSLLVGTMITIYTKAGPDGSLSRELTRFLHLGIFFSFILSLYMVHLMLNTQLRKQFHLSKLVATLLLFVIFASIIPVVSEVSRILHGNRTIQNSGSFFGCTLPANTEYKVLRIEDRIKLLFSAKQVQVGGKC
jgi:hypothetical protein